MGKTPPDLSNWASRKRRSLSWAPRTFVVVVQTVPPVIKGRNGSISQVQRTPNSGEKEHAHKCTTAWATSHKHNDLSHNCLGRGDKRVGEGSTKGGFWRTKLSIDWSEDSYHQGRQISSPVFLQRGRGCAFLVLCEQYVTKQLNHTISFVFADGGPDYDKGDSIYQKGQDSSRL